MSYQVLFLANRDKQRKLRSQDAISSRFSSGSSFPRNVQLRFVSSELGVRAARCEPATPRLPFPRFSASDPPLGTLQVAELASSGRQPCSGTNDKYTNAAVWIRWERCLASTDRRALTSRLCCCCCLTPCSRCCTPRPELETDGRNSGTGNSLVTPNERVRIRPWDYIGRLPRNSATLCRKSIRPAPLVQVCEDLIPLTSGSAIT